MNKFIIFLLCWLIGPALLFAEQGPLAVKGEIDLSSWNFKDSGKIALQGDWAFSWESLQNPEQPLISISTAYMPIPASWDSYPIAGIQTKGYGTYALKIILPPNSPPLALSFFEIYSAYALYANGELIHQEGKVGINEETTTPFSFQRVITLPPAQGELELMLHVSNYDFFKSGLRYHLYIGEAGSQQSTYQKISSIEVILVGGVFLLAAIFTGLYLLRRKDFVHVLFALFCVIVGVHLLFTGGKQIQKIWFNLDWHWVHFLGFGSYFIGVSCFALYLFFLYPKQFDKKYLKPIMGVSLATFFFALVVPTYIYTHLLPYFGLFTLFAMVFFVAVYYRASQTQEPGASIGGVGSTLLFLSIGHDILFGLGFVQTGYINHYFFVFFLFSQAILLSLRMDRTYFRLEGLAHEVDQRDRALMQLRSDVFASTSEDLKNPMQTILGISEVLLEDEELSLAMRESMQKIFLSSVRLRSMLMDILDVAHLGDHELSFHPVALSLEIELDNCINQIRLFDESKGAKFEKQFPPSLSWVWVDSVRLQQVLANLVSQVLLFEPRATVLFMAEENYETGIICLKVGVKGKQIPLNQAGEKSDLEASGKDLNFSILKAVVESQGGGLELNAEGYFMLCLPIAPSKEKLQSVAYYVELAPLAEQMQSSLQSSMEDLDENIKVLIVEDDQISYLLTKGLIEADHVQIFHAANGLVALERIETEEFDIVLMDLMMPWMSGFELCSKIRAKFSKEELPILVITALNQVDELMRVFEVGANDYLKKPFHKLELFAKVHALLDVKRAAKLQKQVDHFNAIHEEMLLAKKRLNQLLDHSLNGMLFASEAHQITYLNQAAASLLGQSKEGLIQTSIDDLFQETVDWGATYDLQCALKSSGKNLNISIIQLQEESGASFVVILSESMLHKASSYSMKSQNKQEVDLGGFSEIITEMVNIAQKEGKPLLSCMHELEQSVGEVANDLKSQELRQSIVDLMNQLILTWEEISGTTKVDLAEESGLWKAYLDRGVFRTRTLDKYLSLETLPAKPRLKDVENTALFVIHYKKAKPSHTKSLQDILTYFQSLL